MKVNGEVGQLGLSPVCVLSITIMPTQVKYYCYMSCNISTVCLGSAFFLHYDKSKCIINYKDKVTCFPASSGTIYPKKWDSVQSKL